MNDALVASVVHDLKNALAVLNSDAGEIATRCIGSQFEADTGRLHANTAALAQRLVAFLTVYRSSQLGLSARLRDHTPEDFLHEVADGLVLPPQAPVLGLAVADDSPPFWHFDDYLVRIALEAAAHNALRFARSRIVLGCGKRESFLVFSVADDGPGLGAESEPSTGLGTTLCREIAQAHRAGTRTGRTLLQDGPDGGALFELWLP